MTPLTQKIMARVQITNAADANQTLIIEPQFTIIRELLSLVESQREALDHYGNKENWSHDGLDPFAEEQGFLWENRFVIPEQDYSNEEGTIMSSGRRAREALTHTDEVLRKLGNGE